MELVFLATTDWYWADSIRSMIADIADLHNVELGRQQPRSHFGGGANYTCYHIPLNGEKGNIDRFLDHILNTPGIYRSCPECAKRIEQRHAIPSV